MSQDFANFRVGHGYDLHRLEDSKPESNTITIGGEKINFNKKIVAHSDGDVVIHALVDSILGALALGDIGEYFSDKDPKWANTDSKIFLQAVKLMLIEHGYKIANIDITIILEAPKLAKIKLKIKQNIANILNLEADQVNVKATTNEKLDAIGKNEALCAHAVCLIYK